MTDLSLAPMANRATHRRMGSSIGQPLTRAEGQLKVTGSATYAADNHPEGMLHAVMAVSGIAAGRVAALDVAAAEAHPGVVAVMTTANRPPLAMDPGDASEPMTFALDLLENDEIRYANQPIAVVIAETLEAAAEGAALLAPQYDAATPLVGLDAGEAFVPPVVGPGQPATADKGDTDAAFADAAVRVETTYFTPPQYHNAMEPHAIVAAWDGDTLSIDMPSQGMAMAQTRIANLMGIDPGAIHIRSPFLGGGFGSKGLIPGPMMLGVLAARLVGKPVKLVVRRDQMFGPVSHRAPTRQTMRIGADDTGRLVAIGHHTRTQSSVFDDFYEPASNTSHSIYASDAIATSHDAVRANVGTPGFMRAPGEASGSIALECAIDEAAYACGMDPLAFRLANYAEVEPMSGKPFSSKALRECYTQGADAFGWARRSLKPRSMRSEDGLLIGWGMGTAIFPSVMFEGHALAVIRDDGRGRIATGAHDMGQGAWTALGQIAADSLGLDLADCDFESGDSSLPDAGIAGGSGHTATVGTAIHEAGAAAIAELAALATDNEASPLYGAGNEGVVAKGGRLHRRDDDSRSESYADILRRAGKTQVEGRGTGAADPARDAYSLHAHGAVFAEVTVDPDLGQVRATRLVGAFAAGRIINPRMVQSQLYGGMIWGVSFALHEHAVVDPRTSKVMNADLAEYHVPVNADVPSIEAIQVPEEDAHVNPLGVKGVGEIGIVGSAGAVANAVWHATGVRPTSFPVAIETLL